MSRARGIKICILCEGYEEIEYIQALKNKGVFSGIYDIDIVNCKSISNIIPRYQNKYQSDSYELVVIFCDTDRGLAKQYKNIKKKINEFHGANVANDIVIFGNPCTMQIILLHFGEVKLTSQSKNVNEKYIQELVGIEKYRATDEQRKELFAKITRRNYENMKHNVKKLSTNDEKSSSTNVLKFFENLESDDVSWIHSINSKL